MRNDEDKKQGYQSGMMFLKISQQKSLPIDMCYQIIKILQNYSSLKIKYHKLQKISQFKNELLQNVINMFQTQESMLITKLQVLQGINMKYIHKYVQAKKRGKLNLNASLKLSSHLQKRQEISGEYKQICSRKYQNTYQNSLFQIYQSIFKSQDWNRFIRESGQKIKEIEQNCTQIIPRKNSGKQLPKVFLNCLDSYCYLEFQDSHKKENIYLKQINSLMEMKKIEIWENASLKRNMYLSDDIQGLKVLLQKGEKFNSNIQVLRKAVLQQQQNLEELVVSLLEQKIELQNLIQDQIVSLEQSHQCGKQGEIKKDHVQFKQKQKQAFTALSKTFISTLIEQQPLAGEIHLVTRMCQRLQAQKSYQQSCIQGKLKQFQDYVYELQRTSHKDKQIIEKLKIQNQKVIKQMKQLSLVKNKYEFFLNSQPDESKQVVQRRQSSPRKSKAMQKAENKFAQSKAQQECQLQKRCLTRKDQLIEIQKQQLARNTLKIQTKMRDFFGQRGMLFAAEGSEPSFEQLFLKYSQWLSQSANERQCQDKWMTAQGKYRKMAQVLREQQQQRMEGLREQLKLSQVQKDSYRNSLGVQQKQFSKLRAFNQKLLVRKSELQMQSAKTQQIFKSVLDMTFAYLMSNISFDNLLQQMESAIENIKLCLKYRQKQSKESPLIDYRFSGLSAVSNDFSFSKLNKQSYCDYFNEQSEPEQESDVISRISSQDAALPPSRPSYSTNLQKRQMGGVDINQRATMAHEDQSLLGYLNPTHTRTIRTQLERNTLLVDGLQDDYIKTLQSNLGNLKTRIPQQTVEVQKETELDAKQMYIKYKQAIRCLEEAEKSNQLNQIHYQNFMADLKQNGVFNSRSTIQNKLFFMDKALKQQQKLLRQQKVQFQTTIADQVNQSQKTMSMLLRNLNKSVSQSRGIK